MPDVIKHDIEKKVSLSISAIENFHKERPCKINISEYPISECMSLISKDAEGGFNCKIFLGELHDHTYNQNVKRFGIFEQIVMDNTGKKYVIPKDAAKNIRLTLSRPQLITLNVDTFHSGTIDDYNNKLHRLVIPTDKEPDFSCIDFKVLKIGDTVTICGLVEIILNNEVYHVFKHTRQKKDYLAIECLERTSLHTFKDNADAIVVALGFITGQLFLGEYYYQTFNGFEDSIIENIYYERRADAIYSAVNLFDPMRFQSYMEHIKKKDLLDKVGTRMKAEMFSNLCKTIRCNSTYARCCKLVIEGNQASHRLLRAGIYSIALETLTNIIYQENEDKINPISDKNLVKLLQDEMRSTLKKQETHLTDYAKSILESKINDLNKPTNSKKLSKPFEIYRIKITKDDVEILNYRNKFLHGTSPFEENELVSKGYELAYVVARLRFMLCSLMLKYVGYRGHIVNQPAWMQLNTERDVTDRPFKLI